MLSNRSSVGFVSVITMPRTRVTPFTNVQYLKIVVWYDITGNLRETQRRFQRRYPNTNPPSLGRILRICQNLLDFGSFHAPVHARGSGRPPVHPRRMYRLIKRYFRSNPQSSTRQAARRFNVSQYYVWKLLNASGMYPYHFQRVHDIVLADYRPRVEFCNWLLLNIHQNILWTDEATFTRIGLFNIHNEHWWSARGHNPHVTRRDAFQVRFSVNVWAGIINDRVIGPYFIEGRLNGRRYLEILSTVVQDFLEDVPVSYLAGMYFQQDGAPAHYFSEVRAYLDREYGAHWIGRGGPIPWPPRSPDLTPLDFYLWGEIKRLVYERESQTLEQLKDKIVSAFTIVKSQTLVLRKIKDNLRRRAQLCLENGGEHFEQLLKYM